MASLEKIEIATCTRKRYNFWITPRRQIRLVTLSSARSLSQMGHGSRPFPDRRSRPGTKSSVTQLFSVNKEPKRTRLGL